MNYQYNHSENLGQVPESVRSMACAQAAMLMRSAPALRSVLPRSLLKGQL